MNRNRVSIRTMMCQPIAQNIDFSGSDQIQTSQYPEIHPPSQEISDEVFQTNHSVQNEESLENSSKEIVVLNSNEEKEGPSQDSDIRKLIREECSTEASEEQKQIMEDTNLMKLESNAENLLPIPSECEVTSEDKRDCDVLVSTIDVCDNHSDIFSDSKNDDDILVYDDDFEDIEYVKASLSDLEIVKFETFCDHLEETRSGNTTHANNSLPEYDSFCFEIVPDQERLINLVKNDSFDDLSRDPLLEEADLLLASDNLIPPGIENVADDSEGDICFLEELLINDSILSHESSDPDFEYNPLILRPPAEPPDAKTDIGEEIPVVMNDKDKFDEDYHFFMFDKVFYLLSVDSEDAIFDPGISD
uniref:Reverse transcriptase domain-containing protein n=1 Tax=Tanacetum cinerariifolium TaxID=118510 RepID=A0A699KF00_TANCI|nr:hypothetical protein [Tanacetum cinerariifolium]